MSWTLDDVVNLSGLLLTYASIPVSVVLTHKLLKRSRRYGGAHVMLQSVLLGAIGGLASTAVAWIFGWPISYYFHWGDQCIVAWLFFLPFTAWWTAWYFDLERWLRWAQDIHLYFWLTWISIPLIFAVIGGLVGALAWLIRSVVGRVRGGNLAR